MSLTMASRSINEAMIAAWYGVIPLAAASAMMSVPFHIAADELSTALQRLRRRRARRDVEVAGQDHALQPLARVRCGSDPVRAPFHDSERLPDRRFRPPATARRR